MESEQKSINGKYNMINIDRNYPDELIAKLKRCANYYRCCVLNGGYIPIPFTEDLLTEAAEYLECVVNALIERHRRDSDTINAIAEELYRCSDELAELKEKQQDDTSDDLPLNRCKYCHLAVWPDTNKYWR